MRIVDGLYQPRSASQPSRYTMADISITRGSVPDTTEARSEIVVVIDVIRAFTTACVLFARGATEIVCVGDMADAIGFDSTALVVGENEDGWPMPGVIPNSPVMVTELDVAARRVCLFTANGTRVLCRIRTGVSILAASAANAAATARWILARTDKPAIRLVVSDPEGPEDYACARHLAGLLTGRHVDTAGVAREVLAAQQVHWSRWGARAAPESWLRFRADVGLCARVDSYPLAMIAEVAPGGRVTLRAVHMPERREVH